MSRLPPSTNRRLWQGCVSGQIPAERLPTDDRERLVRLLHRRGWTDSQIGQHCSMTTYTTARIRSRLGLGPNEAQKGAA